MLRTVLITILLAALGYVGNYLKIPVVYRVDFIFGSVFSLIALCAAGFAGGVLVAFLASVHTFFLWNHPYAIIIFTAEIIWVGIALKRGRTNLILVDSLFWLLLGMPMVAGFYYGIMNLGFDSTLVIMLKQSINGILNALLASILLNHTPVLKWLSGSGRPRLSSYALRVFHLATAFLIIPTLALVLFYNYQNLASTQERVARNLVEDAYEAQADLAHWIENRLRAIRLVSELDIGSQENLQAELQRLHALFPDFHTLFVGDATATTVAFHPPVNAKGESTIGINFADRRWFRDLQSTGKPVFSEVFMGRGGVFEPIIVIAVPVVTNGKLSHFAQGAINIREMATLFKRMGERKDMIYTIVDRNRNIVFSSDPSRRPLSPLPTDGGFLKVPFTAEVSLKVAAGQKNVSVMSTWKEAAYYMTLPIRGTPWELIVEYPVGPLQKSFYRTAILSLVAIAALYIIMIGLAALLSDRLIQPVQSLSRISENIPSRIDNGETLYWPQSDILEVSELIEHFSVTAATLENKLLESRERYKVLVDISPSGIWITDSAGEITYVSSRWVEITGLPAQSALGSGWLDAVHPEDKNTVAAEWSAAVSNGNPFHAEFRLVLEKVGIVWVLAIASIIQETDKISGWIGTITDISQRKEAENALRESEERLSLTLKGTKAGTWDWHVASGTVVFNEQWAGMLGYSLAELQPSTIDTWNRFVHPDDLEISNQLLKRHFAGETDFYECETRMQHKNREWIWVLGRGMVTQRDREGRPTRVTGTHIDITDRKTREKIEAALKEKEILMQEIHHRVKNNLAVVSSLLRMQSHALQDERLKAALLESQNRIQTMSLIHETLYQSKTHAAIDISQYLSKLAGTLIHNYTVGKRISLQVDVDRIDLSVNQASPLGLIVNELISNSLKYAFPDTESPEITIALKKNEDRLELICSDNGIGIPQDLDWENTTSLGLRLVNLLAKRQLNGTIELRRSPGACFIIRFSA